MDDRYLRYFNDNRQSWDRRADVHVRSKFYDVDRFRRDRNSLQAPEKAILDSLEFSDALHLQCHFGLDTLSLAHRYGVSVTGVDFSPRAIHHARELSAELEIPVEWVECNILQLEQHLQQQFDLVFASYGVIGWFPDVNAWMEQAARRLRPGGSLVLVEFHPVIWMFDDALEELVHAYFNRGPITAETSGSYAQVDADLSTIDHGWNHPLADVIAAGQGAGLMFCTLREFDYSPFEVFPPMSKNDLGFVHQAHKDRIPYVYSLVMQRPKSGGALEIRPHRVPGSCAPC
jgi:SAM-dependent methyltransferase